MSLRGIETDPHTAGHQGGHSSTEHPLPHAGTPQRPSITGPTEEGCVLHTLTDAPRLAEP